MQYIALIGHFVSYATTPRLHISQQRCRQQKPTPPVYTGAQTPHITTNARPPILQRSHEPPALTYTVPECKCRLSQPRPSQTPYITTTPLICTSTRAPAPPYSRPALSAGTQKFPQQSGGIGMSGDSRGALHRAGSQHGSFPLWLYLSQYLQDAARLGHVV